MAASLIKAQSGWSCSRCCSASPELTYNLPQSGLDLAVMSTVVVVGEILRVVSANVVLRIVSAGEVLRVVGAGEVLSIGSRLVVRQGRNWLIETHVGIRRLNKVSTLRFWRNWLAKAHVGVIRSDWKGKGLLSGLDVAILGVDGSGAWKRFQC
ncbi:hypothetical protein KCU86_g31, partial [Aureobasidium melanogenum]